MKCDDSIVYNVNTSLVIPGNSLPFAFHPPKQSTSNTTMMTAAAYRFGAKYRNVFFHSYRSVSTLILLRHGQSQWNGPDSRFTGWCDIPLTVRGRVEAVAAGQLMRSRGFKAKRVCVAFASELQRSHETCELALASMAGHEQHTWCSDRIRRDVRLNERHYGAVQGKLKQDPDLIQQYGNDKLMHWRRSLHGRPPPMDETHPYYQADAPLTESLADCQRRVLDCWEDAIAPSLFEEEGLPIPPDNRAIVVVAHANTIRSLVAHFDNVPEERVTKIYIPNSVPILYRFDTDTRQPVSIKLDSSHGGSHARWMLSAENHRAVREAVAPGGVLTRAIFDAMGAGKDLTLSGAELEMGLKELEKDDAAPIDCAVIAVAKRLARKLSPDEKIHFKEFVKIYQDSTEAMELKHLNPSDIIPEEGHGSY